MCLPKILGSATNQDSLLHTACDFTVVSSDEFELEFSGSSEPEL